MGQVEIGVERRLAELAFDCAMLRHAPEEPSPARD